MATDIDMPLMVSVDRAEVARCLAKAIAYKQCGRDAEAAEWAAQLVKALQCARILARG